MMAQQGARFSHFEGMFSITCTSFALCLNYRKFNSEINGWRVMMNISFITMANRCHFVHQKEWKERPWNCTQLQSQAPALAVSMIRSSILRMEVIKYLPHKHVVKIKCINLYLVLGPMPRLLSNC